MLNSGSVTAVAPVAITLVRVDTCARQARRMRIAQKRVKRGRRMSRVLLVDNEPEGIEAMRLLLESDQHHVITALDGWEAFEQTNSRAPDIVVTDWHMPRVDGLAFCRMLRHANPNSTMPVILLSSEMPPTDRSTSLYDRYLRKPVTPDELLQLIRRLVASHG
jgi:CheY-like chemotaxis protein